MRNLWKLNKNYIILISIALLGIFFRFYNLNWDQNTHIHPDERFLTMVGNAMSVPRSFSDYLNPDISTFNPSNIGYKFFVYGLFPLSLNKIIAVISNNDNYNAFNVQGRFLSALADLLVLYFIYKFVGLLEEKYKIHSSVKFFAVFLYSVFILPIQLSHFFAVDTFLNLFTFMTFYFAFSYWGNKKIRFLLLSGAFFGLALASKITGFFILLLIIPFFFSLEKTSKFKAFTTFFFKILIFGMVSYLILRIANPYIFASSNILNPTISPLFIKNLNELKYFASKDSFYPPNVQWINKISILFVLKNIAVFGIGIPASILFFMGIKSFLRIKAKNVLLWILIWIFVFILYQGTQISVPMRYFILAYPFISIVGAFGIGKIYQKFGKNGLVLTVILLLIWPLMFLSIYLHSHSRVSASNWILQNIPKGNVILSEAWDDALPLMGGENYPGFQLPVFDPDSREKWQKMDELLKKGDYLILSSNRGWGSIPTVSQRYPQMTKFYKDLFEGKLEYRKIKEFTSYPSLVYLGIPITFPDQWADESFTVYDHPKVIIFKNINNAK